MSSESDPIDVATQDNAPAEGPRTELSEIDKILIQDKLNERGRVRDALTETFRYATIAVAGILSYFIGITVAGGINVAGTNKMKAPGFDTLISPASPIPLIWALSCLVLALAASRTAYFLKRLEIAEWRHPATTHVSPRWQETRRLRYRAGSSSQNQ